MKEFKFSKYLFMWIIITVTALMAGCAGTRGAAGTKRTETVPLSPPQAVQLSKEGKRGADATAATVKEGAASGTQEASGDSEQAGKTSSQPASSADVDKAATQTASAPKSAQPAAKIPPPPAKVFDAQNKTGQKIVLNFDNADLYAVISTIGEILGLNYIVDPNVTGKVTINTAGGLYKEDLFTVFLQILEVNGLAAIKEGSLYRIVQMKESSRMSIETRLDEDEAELPPLDKIIIQIIPLKFISVQEMTKLLTPFMTTGGTIVSDAGSNTLVVVDKGINVMKILRLVETFDVNLLERVHYRFYTLKYLDAEDVAKTLSDFTTSYGKATNVFVKFIAISRLNTLFTVSTSPLVFEKIEEILRQIDVVDKEVAPKVYVYFVKNGEAEDLADLLDKVFKKKSSSKDKSSSSKKKAGGSAAIAGNPFSESRMAEKRATEKAEKAAAKTRAETPAEKSGASAKGEGEGAGSLMGEVHITPDEVRNALIIEAIPADYHTIETILRKIDIMPRQVLIEATIAEITVNTSTELGMEWALGSGAAVGNAAFAASAGKAGLRYSIGVTNKWYAALHALASEGKVNVLSSPHVLASDNKEAKIDVSREIPIASGTTTIASSTVVGETTIEYRDTGVILSVTPHINERGMVTMDISEEVSDLEKESVNVAGENYPAFFKRTVNTTLTVRHGQTIAIGGLIKDKEDENISGVPCLIKIPVLRYLVGEWGKDVEKIELIVLITPRVVANLDDVDAVTDEFKQKVRNVMRRFYPQ